MNPRHHLLVSLAALFVLALSGAACDKKDAERGAKEAAGSSEEIAGALEAYERIRARLALDELSVAEDAGALAKAARAAAEEAPEEQRQHLERLASAAAELGEVGDDPDAVREAFGEVSRPLVALLSADAELAEGQHVFECPMAKGYKKWVQPDPEISNPYMGTEMPKCGSEVDWDAPAR